MYYGQTERPQFECIHIYITVMAVHSHKKGHTLLFFKFGKAGLL